MGNRQGVYAYLPRCQPPDARRCRLLRRVGGLEMENPDTSNESVKLDSWVPSGLTGPSKRRSERSINFNIQVGQQIRHRRKQMHWSQEKLGDMVNRTFQQIQKYENGTNQISAAFLLEISEVLHVPITYFYGDISQSLSDCSVSKIQTAESDNADQPASEDFWRSVAKVIEYARANPIIQASLASCAP
jgi:transcriptional regulator with XRE-family HTH domain